VGAGLTFSIALLLTGMVSGFDNEIDRTVASARADGWVLPKGTSGPFTAVRAISGSTVRTLAADKGVEDASDVVYVVKSGAVETYRELSDGGEAVVTAYTLRRFRREHPSSTGKESARL